MLSLLFKWAMLAGYSGSLLLNFAAHSLYIYKVINKALFMDCITVLVASACAELCGSYSNRNGNTCVPLFRTKLPTIYTAVQ